MADALHDAALDGDLARLRAVLATGVDVDATRGGCGLTSLHVAALHSRTACLEALLAAGASVHSEGSFGMTPLYVTIWNSKSCGRASRVRALIAAGSDVNHATSDGWTPFSYALHNGHCGILKILLRAGAKMNTQNVERRETVVMMTPGLPRYGRYEFPENVDAWALVDEILRHRAAISDAFHGTLPESIALEIASFAEPPGGDSDDDSDGEIRWIPPHPAAVLIEPSRYRE